jgi:hypothetical protein
MGVAMGLRCSGTGLSCRGGGDSVQWRNGCRGPHHGCIGWIKTVLGIGTRIRRTGATRHGDCGARRAFKANQVVLAIVVGFAMSLTLL